MTPAPYTIDPLLFAFVIALIVALIIARITKPKDESEE